MRASARESLSCLSALRFKCFQGLEKDREVRVSGGGRGEGQRDRGWETEREKRPGLSSLLAQGSFPANLLQPALYPLLSFTLSPSLACGLHSVFHFKKHISISNYGNENQRKKREEKKHCSFSMLGSKVKHRRLEGT